jgi:hypothetical protein
MSVLKEVSTAMADARHPKTAGCLSPFGNILDTIRLLFFTIPPDPVILCACNFLPYSGAKGILDLEGLNILTEPRGVAGCNEET